MPFLQPNDKVQAEIRDYRRLCELGIRLPAMLDIDIAKERILKEYIDGPTVYNLVLTTRWTTPTWTRCARWPSACNPTV